MTILFKDKFKTNSQRLQSWDYSSEAVYFITIVTRDRKCIFGTIEKEKMILNENGKIVENELLKSIKIRKNWFFHNWIIMPNHIHLLIEIQDGQNNVSENSLSEPYIVETHCSASTSSISTTENTNSDSNLLSESHIVETHCSASTSSISTTENTNSDSNLLSEQHIVETHCSASMSSISATGNNVSENSLSTCTRETHSSAPLQNQSEVKSDSGFLSEPHIVEAHCSASTSSISATGNNVSENSLSTCTRETHSNAPLQNKFSRRSNSISSFVAIFKSVTTRQINGSESIWQANYHDHIVRNYKRFEKIYDYIKNNPRSWETDSLK